MDKILDNKELCSRATKREKILFITICAALVFAIAGISFGLCELIVNIKKDEEISELHTRIKQLESNNASETKEGARIKVISSSWSGWSRDYVPEETESYCSLELNKKCVVKTRQYSRANGERYEEDVLSFEVVKINNDSVAIHTFQNFSDSKEGIDLRSKKRDFVIKNGESIELTTPTMDYGDIFTLTLLRG